MELLSPANRSGPEWAGLSYGVETSPFLAEGYSYPSFGLGIGCMTSLKMPIAAADDPKIFNFSRLGFTVKQEAVERLKWRNALTFYAQTKVMDLSYDGAKFNMSHCFDHGT